MMNSFKSHSNHLSTIAWNARSPVPERLKQARIVYRGAREKLFDLCYEIQVTGVVADPVVLTEAVIDYKDAWRLVEALSAATQSVTPESTDTGEARLWRS